MNTGGALAGSMRSYEGACHCGATGFDYRTALEPEEWPVRACQCTFCRTHGALSTSDSLGTLKFFERTPAALNRYRFGLKTADFLICRHCGVYIGALLESPRGAFGIINVRALPALLERLKVAQPMEYESEGAADRTGRRESRWTPVGDG
jgi:hypothetical protein